MSELKKDFIPIDENIEKRDNNKFFNLKSIILFFTLAGLAVVISLLIICLIKFFG